MIKKTIQYTNIDGKKVTKELHFHLFPQDLEAMLEDGTYDRLMDMQDLVQAISQKAKNEEPISDDEQMLFTSKYTALFRYFVEKSYGRRVEDEDGDADFEKDPERTKRFMNSSAYGALFMQVLGDPELGFNFMNDLIPTDAIDQMKKANETRSATQNVQSVVVPNAMPATAPVMNTAMYQQSQPGYPMQATYRQ